MFHHSILIHKIALALQKKLAGKKLSSCFSQNKDELILIFTQAEESFFIKADLRPQIALLSFSDSFSRARKNSVDLFPEVTDKDVTAVKPHRLNRSFEIEFDDMSLVFKLYGRRSNVILYDNLMLTSLFRSELKQDFQLSKSEWYAQEKLLPETDPESIEQVLTKDISEYFHKAYVSIPFHEAIDDFLSQPTYVIDAEKPIISLIKTGNPSERSYDDVLEAVNSYHQLFVRKVLFKREHQQAIQQLKQKRDQTINYLSKTKNKLSELKNRRSFREIADIIMANLHQISTGTTKITLFDFYRNEDISIRLKEKLSPQHNAELLYKKAKNENLEYDKLKENFEQKEAALKSLEEQIQKIESLEDWKELRKATSNIEQNSEQKQLPYFSFWYAGYEIRVGKDARRNDELTTRFTAKDDTWLHAKDVPGSHVVIKSPSKTKPPKDVIEYAARLAAYYSKRKNDKLCPVLFTPRKYVRKAKKLAAGKVLVEREEVILVEPLNPHKT